MKLSVASYIRSMAVIAGLVDHAKKELELAGLFDKDSDYGGMIGKAVMELCKCFADQGHSGFSAGMVLELFRRLGKFEQLTPVTDNSKEWNDVSEMSGDKNKLWQSKRNPSFFSENGGKSYYDVNDKKRKKNRSKNNKKASEKLTPDEIYEELCYTIPSDKPSIFSRTIYRLPTKEELMEVVSYDLSPDEIYKGLCYTIVGRGIMRQKEKDTIVESSRLLNRMFPGKYKDVLKKAEAISLFRPRR